MTGVDPDNEVGYRSNVIFQSTGGMFWARADGAGKPRSLTQSKKLQFPSSFSPNGKWLTFTELTSGTASEIRTLRVESIAGQLRTGESKPFLKGSTTNSYAVFSPDGRWLAYTDPPAGTYEVYVEPSRTMAVRCKSLIRVGPVRSGPEMVIHKAALGRYAVALR